MPWFGHEHMPFSLSSYRLSDFFWGKLNCSKFGKIPKAISMQLAPECPKSVIGFSLASTPYRALMSEQPPPPNLFAGYRPESSRLCRPDAIAAPCLGARRLC